jgi:glycerophosphoryl diester phosphodiesterase
MKSTATFIFLLFVACSSNKKMTATQADIPGSPFYKQGHRGCRGLMPENTIPAMLKAIDLGVTTLELDIIFTKDKVALLSHEPFFNHEITTTPDGKFLEEKEERKFNIYQMSFEETQKYDVGLKAHPRFPTQQKIKATKPSLASMIDSVEKYLLTHKPEKVEYNIETKTNPATDNIYHPAPAEFVTLLMEVIKSKGIENRVIIQSFDFRTLQIIHQKYPAVKTSMLIEDYDKRTLECHDKKIKIIPWTVNDAIRINDLKKSGVDGIITDYPDLFNE